MRFGLDTDQEDMRRLVADVLADFAADLDWRVAEDRELSATIWKRLAGLDLLCAGLPERWGGTGGGAVETTAIAQEIGRAGLPLPYVSALPTAAAAIARFGDESLCGTLLPAIMAGELLPTVAIPPLGGAGPELTRRGAGAVLSGRARYVPAPAAGLLLVVARVAGGAEALVFVDPDAVGLDRQLVQVTDHSSEAHFEFDEVLVEAGAVLAGEDSEGGDWLRWRALAASCGTQIGLCSAALVMAAAHCVDRRQFGRRLSDFQAVTQRLADAYIDLRAMRAATARLASALDAGDPAAELEAAALVAKCSATEAAPRILRAAVHVHGGVGVDVTYPLARYVVMSKREELWLGGLAAHLERLGELLGERDDLDSLMLG